MLLLGGLIALALGGSSAAGATEAEPLHARSGTFAAEGKCALNEPGGVAVNEATGDVYVVEKEKQRIVEFGPNGECLAMKGLPWSPEWIAVDNSTGGESSGDVYVTTALKEGEPRFAVKKLTAELTPVATVDKYFNEEEPPKEKTKTFEQLGEEVLGVGVAGSGNLWIYTTAALYEFNNAKVNKSVSRTELASTCGALPGLAVVPDASQFFIGRERESRGGECEGESVMMRFNSTGEPFPYGEAGGLFGSDPYFAQFDVEPTTGAAVDPQTRAVYFDNGTSVAEYNASGSFVQRFGDEKPSVGSPLEEGRGLAVNGKTDQVFVADAAAHSVDVFGTRPEGQGAAGQKGTLADGREWELVSPANERGAALLSVNINNGLIQASEDGKALTYASSAPIVAGGPSSRSPESADNLARRTSTGWSTETLALPRSATATGVVVENGTEYKFFSSDLHSAVIEQNPGVFEAHEPPLAPGATETTLYRRDLGRVDSECEPEPSTCFQALVSPLDTATPEFGDLERFIASTRDSKHVIIGSAVALTPEDATEAKEAAASASAFYEWTAEPGAGEPSLQLINQPPAGEAKQGVEGVFGGKSAKSPELTEPVSLRNAVSSDGSRVVWQNIGNRLYLRDMKRHETIRIDVPEAGIEPVEEPGAHFLAADSETRTIFFTDSQHLTKNASGTEGVETPERQEDLYVCEVPETKLECKPQDLTAGVTTPGEAASVQGVVGTSNDGSVIYFVADGVLAPHAGRGHCGYDGENEEGVEREGKTPVARCNLYVVRRGPSGWGSPRFLAALSNADSSDWLAERPNKGLTSRVSGNGQFVAFMSAASLTGYNNIDTVSGVRDQEVYIDDTSKEAGLTCVSCGPGGEAPHGVLDRHAAGEGPGLLIDQAQTWRDDYLAGNISGWTAPSNKVALYLARNLGEDGRLFFNATGKLAPADENEKADVYEYEPQGVGSCTSSTGCISLISNGKSTHESAFLDASSNGNDAFFLSAFPLVSLSPEESATHVYDAHVCSEASPCLHPTPVEQGPCSVNPSEANCKGPGTSVPAPPPVGPTTATGPGNVPHIETRGLKVKVPPPPKPRKLTKAQLLARALKACRKHHNKHVRQQCERNARKHYGKSARRKHKHGGRR